MSICAWTSKSVLQAVINKNSHKAQYEKIKQKSYLMGFTLEAGLNKGIKQLFIFKLIQSLLIPKENITAGLGLFFPKLLIESKVQLQSVFI